MNKPTRKTRKRRAKQERSRKKALGEGLTRAARDLKNREGVVPDWLHERMKDK